MELGLAHTTLAHTGSCKKLNTWVVDTATIYTLGITRTGIATAFLGVLAMICGGALMALNQNNAWAGVGLWTGTPMFICGLTCLAFRHKRPTSMCSGNNVLCVLGVFAATVLMVTSVINMCGLTADPERFYPHYIYNVHHSGLPLFALNGMLLAIAPLEFLLTMWLFAISMAYVCPCLTITKDQVYTIRCEDGTDTHLEPARETELAMDHFTAGRDTDRILKVDSDWLQQLPDEKESSGPTR